MIFEMTGGGVSCKNEKNPAKCMWDFVLQRIGRYAALHRGVVR